MPNEALWDLVALQQSPSPHPTRAYGTREQHKTGHETKENWMKLVSHPLCPQAQTMTANIPEN